VAGLFAEGRVETGGSQVLMLPEGALVRAGEAAHVWRLEGTTLRKAAVTLGQRDARNGEFPVRSGLAAGAQVLRHPVGNLRDGQTVELARAAATPPAAAAAAAASAAR
jgi:hypothetical protein